MENFGEYVTNFEGKVKKKPQIILKTLQHSK